MLVYQRVSVIYDSSPDGWSVDSPNRWVNHVLGSYCKHWHSWVLLGELRMRCWKIWWMKVKSSCKFYRMQSVIQFTCDVGHKITVELSKWVKHHASYSEWISYDKWNILGVFVWKIFLKLHVFVSGRFDVLHRFLSRKCRAVIFQTLVTRWVLKRGLYYPSFFFKRDFNKPT